MKQHDPVRPPRPSRKRRAIELERTFSSCFSPVLRSCWLPGPDYMQWADAPGWNSLPV